jgi:hypothetical protein
LHLEREDEEEKDPFASRDIRNTRVPNRHTRMMEDTLMNQEGRNRSMLEYEVFAGDSLEF